MCIDIEFSFALHRQRKEFIKILSFRSPWTLLASSASALAIPHSSGSRSAPGSASSIADLHGEVENDQRDFRWRGWIKHKVGQRTEGTDKRNEAR